MDAFSRSAIQSLEDQGFRVYITHRRPVASAVTRSGLYTRHELEGIRTYIPANFLPKGGHTEVTIADGDGDPVAVGRAQCSQLDNFNRTRGVSIALGRAVKELRQCWGVEL